MSFGIHLLRKQETKQRKEAALPTGRLFSFKPQYSNVQKIAPKQPRNNKPTTVHV